MYTMTLIQSESISREQHISPVYPNHPNITINIIIRGITVFPRTHFGSSPNRTPSFRAHNSVVSEPNTQRHPLSNHFGSRPNRTPMAVYCINTLVLARTEHPALSAGVSGVPLQAGLTPGNSLHDFPVSPADITKIGYVCPARAFVLTPTSDTLTIQV